MSNPFLRNNNNNRFNLLNYDPPVNNNHFDENRNRNRNSYVNNNNNNKRIDNNRFKSILSSEQQQPKMNVDIDNIISFPSLVNTKECDTPMNTSSKFKDILNTGIEEDIIENKYIILPGWLQLTMLNGNILKNEYKDEDEKNIEQEQDQQEQQEQQEQLNYDMYKIGKALQTNYELYEKEYDSINGEGSYDKKFRLSPVYGYEYDSNSESEEYNEEDDYEYEN